MNAPERSATWPITIAGIKRELRLFEISPGVRIAILNILGDSELVAAASVALASRLREFNAEVLVSPEAKAIPLAYALSMEMQLPYVVLRKSHKPYMGDALAAETLSITTGQPQMLFLDERDRELVRGSRVILLDDVISTGSTLQGLRLIMGKAFAEVVAEAAILTEGDRASWSNIVALLDPASLGGRVADTPAHASLPGQLLQHQQMRQAPQIQRAALHALQQRAQHLRRPTETPDQVVVTAVDTAHLHNARGAALRQSQQTAPRVGTHVRCQAVTQGVRQPVDERRVAEVITAAPVVAVRLKGIPAVGAEYYGAPAGLQHTQHLLQGQPVILHMLQHFVGEHGVEAFAGIGQLLGSGDDRLGRRRPRLQRPAWLDVEERNRSPVALAHLRGVHANAAAGFQHERMLQPRMTRNHLQAALLAGAPHIAWLTAQRGL